ncbi:MAG TPA: aldo/keto reductase [Vicinamibacterales bacterium]|nr:aldo/keto reductase [Vicinamibacterales bacterium]
MHRRTLGNSGLAITAIGLGTWAIGGGDWVFGWGPQRDADSLATIRRAIDAGINWIDTAAAYGLGHAETIVGRALRGLRAGERPYAFTQCSLVWDDLGNVSPSLAPRSIRREAEASLQRLGVDCIDVYQLGWPAAPNHASARRRDSLGEAWSAMAALQREGKVRAIGVANCDVDELDDLRRIAAVASLQVPYSLLLRRIERRTLAYCERHAIGVIACSTLGAGLLTGHMTRDRVAALPHNDWRRRSPSFQDPGLSDAQCAVERLQSVALRSARTASDVAVAWTLRNPAVTAAAVGLRQPQQVDEIAGAASFLLSDADIKDLEDDAHDYG